VRSCLTAGWFLRTARPLSGCRPRHEHRELLPICWTRSGHIRAGYPGYTRAGIDSGGHHYLAYLSAVGALGILCWRIVAVRRRYDPDNLFARNHNIRPQ
jgi:hypothetical protein